MTRAEVGAWPLFVNITKWAVGYVNRIKKRPESAVFEADLFQTKNDVNPNFIGKQNLKCNNIYEISKVALTKQSLSG